MFETLPTHALYDDQHAYLSERYLWCLESDHENPDSFFKLKEEVESGVVEVRAATDVMEDLAPHYKKLFPGGRWLKAGAPAPADAVRHGYDDQGRIVIIDGIQCILFRYGDHFAEKMVFGTYYRINVLMHFYYDEQGKLKRVLSFGGYSGVESVYEWAGDRVERVVKRCWKCEEYLFKDEPWSDVITHQEIQCLVFEYGLDNEVEQIRREYPNSSNQIVEYRRHKKGDTVKSLSREIEHYLLKRIPDFIGELTIDSPAYCLFIAYCSSNLNLPPVLIVGTEKGYEQAGIENKWFIGEISDEWRDFRDPVFAGRAGSILINWLKRRTRERPLSTLCGGLPNS